MDDDKLHVSHPNEPIKIEHAFAQICEVSMQILNILLESPLPLFIASFSSVIMKMQIFGSLIQSVCVCAL